MNAIKVARTNFRYTFKRDVCCEKTNATLLFVTMRCAGTHVKRTYIIELITVHRQKSRCFTHFLPEIIALLWYAVKCFCPGFSCVPICLFQYNIIYLQNDDIGEGKHRTTT